ncbi:FadR/GntR family transcriptional regulator [Pirellulaceae bacterium SH449]
MLPATNAPKKPARPLLVEHVEAALTNFIRTEGVRPGDRLPSEAELSAKMQCSRNVLREAVGRLASHGVIEVRRGLGMFVGTTDTIRSFASLLRSSMTISVGDLLEFTEFRRAIEGYAARQAAVHASNEELAELSRLAEEIDDPKISREESLYRDTKFHLRLMEIGGNRLMTVLLESLLEFLHASMDSTTAKPRDTETSRRLHAIIIDGLMRRDPEAADQAMETNRQFTASKLKSLSDTGSRSDSLKAPPRCDW